VKTTIKDFLGKYIKPKTGKIINENGKIIVEHHNLLFYTIGQKKGIGLSGGFAFVRPGRTTAGKPYYVLSKDIKNNVLTVTQNERDLYGKEPSVKNVNWISRKKPKMPFKIAVKIRYRGEITPAVMRKIHNNNYKLQLNKPQRAIASGQSIVFYKEEELFKKCGFKKADDFIKQVEWNAKYDSKKYYIEVFAKTDGRPNSENKYDFPPPIDTKLFFGSCAILAYLKKDDGSKGYTDLTLQLWNKIYEKLFGGFEDLAATAKEDEEEEDELENVPKEKKTKQGYLKDGFVVDSSDTEENYISSSTSEDDNDTEEESYDNNTVFEDVGSELSEESYDYDDKNVGK
jgi:hypothetical protein